MFDLQRIFGHNLHGIWWHDNVLILQIGKALYAYGGVPEDVYQRLRKSEEPDLLHSLLIEHKYPRERVFLAPSQPSTIDPLTLPF